MRTMDTIPIKFAANAEDFLYGYNIAEDVRYIGRREENGTVIDSFTVKTRKEYDRDRER